MFFVKGVNAKVYTIEEFANKYNEIMDAGEIDANAYIENDKLQIYDKNKTELLFTFYHDGKSIYYEDYESVVSETKERFMYDINALIHIDLITETIMPLMGYENVEIDEELMDANNYDKYGFILNGEPYEFKYEDENSHSRISGTIIRNFRISLDSDKIANLVNDYSILKLDFIPSLEIKEITENSVTLNVKSNYEDTSKNDKLKYYIMRSENEDYGYERINENTYNYGSTTTITDNNLESGKTYYYKVYFINNDTTYDNIVIATTISNNNTENEENNNNNSNTTESENKTPTEETTKDGRTNPKTGAKLPTTIMLLFLISTIIFKNKLSKKSLFKRL